MVVGLVDIFVGNGVDGIVKFGGNVIWEWDVSKSKNMK